MMRADTIIKNYKYWREKYISMLDKLPSTLIPKPAPYGIKVFRKSDVQKQILEGWNEFRLMGYREIGIKLGKGPQSIHRIHKFKKIRK